MKFKVLWLSAADYEKTEKTTTAKIDEPQMDLKSEVC